MKCEEIRDELIAYIKGELSDDSRSDIDEHLVRCLGCRRELEMSQKLLAQTQSANETSIVDLANSIIEDAIKASASDIHISPSSTGADVRFRIDGVLHISQHLNVQTRDAVIARFKMMGEIPVSETRTPHDSRFTVKVDNVDYDLRISTMPYALGEKAVMRILSREQPLIGIEKMGFLPEQMEMVESLIRCPSGTIIFSGPGGSGKTTTMYSVMQMLINPEFNIVTIEDPVEYLFKGVDQAQVNVKNGFTYAVALRTILRQDPDIIIVGNVKDTETMEITAEAAISGHLVLSVMNSDNAVSVPKRMISYGVEPFVVGESLLAIISQILVRKICPDCKEEYKPSDDALRWLGLSELANKFTFYHGAGCDSCRGVGLRGRTQLHEILEIDNELRRMISAGQTEPNIILRYAVEKGFITMIEVARRMVLSGVTTAEEVYRLRALISGGPV
ncbi:MAG: ATPase, T2SS/T4P/T4SS family [Armatimonadota bacterium]